MNDQIVHIKNSIASLKEQIVHHPLYASIRRIEDVQIFMKYHVYAVWDFMSLLKSLQQNLTCVTIPWFPKGDADTRFLINEIVAGEESDVDEEGNRTSHFELYLAGMKQSGADMTQIEQFIAALQQDGSMQQAFDAANVPEAARRFVDFTFGIIGSNKPHVQAAVFSFGREDLIPDMFHSIVADLDKQHSISLSTYKYYLERHIEVDGGHHSELALRMTTNLCGNNQAYWQEATEAVIASLQQRVKLWDGAYQEIIAR